MPAADSKCCFVHDGESSILVRLTTSEIHMQLRVLLRSTYILRRPAVAFAFAAPSIIVCYIVCYIDAARPALAAAGSPSHKLIAAKDERFQSKVTKYQVIAKARTGNMLHVK